jgi:hypothetical protein
MQMIALLQKGDVRLSQVDEVAVSQQTAAILLTVLAQDSTASRAELLQRAELLNTNTYFPHEFLCRAIAKLRAQPDR